MKPLPIGCDQQGRYETRQPGAAEVELDHITRTQRDYQRLMLLCVASWVILGLLWAICS